MYLLFLLNLLLALDTPPVAKPRREFRYGSATAGRATFGNDGRLVLVSGSGSRIAVFHGRTALLFREFRGHRHPIGDLTSWVDRDTVVSGDASGLVIFWQAKTARPLGQAQVPGPVMAVRPQPGGRLVAVLAKQTIWLVDVPSGRKQSLAKAFPGRIPTALSFNPAGTQLAVGFADGGLAVRDMKSARQVQARPFRTPVCALTFGGDTLLAVAGTTNVGIWQPSATGGTQLRPVSAPARAIARQPGGGLVLGLTTGAVIRYEPTTRQEQLISWSKSPVRGLAVHPREPLVLATYALTMPKTWLLDQELSEPVN